MEEHSPANAWKSCISIENLNLSELTESTKWTITWKATNATRIQSNQLGSSALANLTAKKIVTTSMEKRVQYDIPIKIQFSCARDYDDLLARMCATFPPSQWSQLKIGRLLEVGAGRNKAPNGCKKQIIVVTVPRIAWGLSSADQVPSSTKINTNAAIVNPHVRIMNIRCHWN